jgi:hypothetical protein
MMLNDETHVRLLDAIRTINELHNLGDATYAVRDRYGSEPVRGAPYTGNSWLHPKVSAYSEAVQTLRDLGVIK